MLKIYFINSIDPKVKIILNTIQIVSVLGGTFSQSYSSRFFLSNSINEINLSSKEHPLNTLYENKIF